MKKIKIAIVRGWYLNPWEMMRYEPLRDEFDITAMGTYRSLFDQSGIKLNIRKYHWPGEALYGLGTIPAQLINRALYKYFRYNLWMFGLERDLKDFDVIHSADTLHLFSLQAARARKKYGSKLVLTVWENIPFQDEKRGILRRISREIKENTDIFLPVTDRSREMLLVQGVPEDKIVVIPQPVDLQKFTPRAKNRDLLTHLGCKEGQPVILFTGRLHRTKGVEYLLYAIKRLILDKDVSGHIFPRVLLVGTGEREKAIRTLIDRLALSQHVHMCGAVPHNALSDYYAAADMFVLPSIPADEWQEQFGMVLVEAMACGKAVISTRSGSIPDVVGDAGILVQPADFTALYRAIRELLSNPALMSEYGRRARARAEKVFSPLQVAEQTSAVYRRLVGNSK